MILTSQARDLGVELPDRSWRLLADSLERGHAGAGPERGLARAQGVEDAAQAEQVGPVIDRLAAGLLGRHVLGRPGHHARLGHRGVVHRAGQPEVGDLDPLDAVLQQDVRGLDVAMDQPLGVGRGQGAGGLAADAEDLGQLGGLAPVDQILDRLAGDVLHHQVGDALGRGVHGVDRDDVLVDHGRRGLCLPREPPRGPRGRGHPGGRAA